VLGRGSEKKFRKLKAMAERYKKITIQEAQSEKEKHEIEVTSRNAIKRTKVVFGVVLERVERKVEKQAASNFSSSSTSEFSVLLILRLLCDFSLIKIADTRVEVSFFFGISLEAKSSHGPGYRPPFKFIKRNDPTHQDPFLPPEDRTPKRFCKQV
jgi:hypothetical protein